MPPTSLVLPAFAAGEVSPRLHGRVDVAKYHVGCNTLLNWYVVNTGGAATRAGTAWVGEVYDSAARSRLISFQFNQVQAYVLEFANLKMRVIMNGGYVLETAGAITGITNANPGSVTQVAHGYTTGDHVWLEGNVGMTQVNRRRFPIIVTSANTYTIGIDTAAYGTWTAGGTGARFYTLTTPYVTADLALLKFVQSADTMTITHPSYAPRALTRTGHTSWTLTAITFAPIQQPPTGLASSHVGVNILYGITAVNDVTGEESRAATVLALDTTTTLTFTPAAGATFYNVYRNLNGVLGFIGRSSSGGSFTDNTFAPNVSDTPPLGNNPFSGAGAWPGCVTYHDGRIWYGRTDNQPQTLFASQSGAFNNMDTSSPSQDSDAITETIASREVNEIRFLLSLDQLLVFTSGAIWKAWPGSQVDVITPTNLSVKPQIYDGSAQIPPIATGETSALYVTASGKRVRDIQPTAYSTSFTTNLVSVLSQHLFKGTLALQEAAYAKDPDGIVWYVRNDGVLLSFTYLNEQQIYAWARHTTQGAVESVAVAQESNETILYVAVARTIGGVTKRYVERMSTRVFPTIYDAFCVDSGYTVNNWNVVTTQTLKISGATYNAGDTVTLDAVGFTPFTNPGSIGQQYILRDAASQSQVSVTITAFTSTSQVTATLDVAPFTSLQNVATSDYALGINSLSGLWHLEGQTLKIFADGSVEPNAVVTNGTITLAHVCGRVLAGLSYVCDLETLDIEAGQPTIQGRLKKVSEVTLRLEDTRGLSAGPTFDRLTEIKERSTENFGFPTALTTGDEKITIDPSWNSNGRVCVRQANPLPAMLAAIIPKIDVGE